jgi:hypothetical protein
MAEKARLGVYTSILVAVIGLFSGVFGAYVTARATTRTILAQSALELRKKAYADFLQGQTLLRAAHDQSETDEANKVITEAKFNILMVGSTSVICSMVDYWISAHREQYPACQNPALERQDAAIYQAMRKEVFFSLGLGHPELEPALTIKMREKLCEKANRNRWHCRTYFR